MERMERNFFAQVTHYNILLLLTALVSMIAVKAQNKQSIRELQVGEKMPDVTLADVGDVVYNNTGKTRFSDFKGKLIILDFWDINCGSCIAGFPKMEKIQQQFKDSIQIILVNAGQNRLQIANDLKNIKTNPFPYDLPQIVNARLLGQLFPYEYSGNQIWIDGDGVIRLNGSPMNTHVEKIRQILSGNVITYVKEGKRRTVATAFELPSINSLYNKEIKFVPLQQSSIFPFNWNIGASGGARKGLIDSIAKTSTTRYLNVSLLTLFNDALKQDFIEDWKNEIALPYGTDYLNKYVLNVVDTLRYTDYFSQPHRDIDWLKSQYCYEQVVPLDLPEEKRRKYMLQDLKQYFGNLYGTKVSVETCDKTCYLLVKTPQFDTHRLKLKTNSDLKNSSVEVVKVKGKKINHYHNFKLVNVLQSYAGILFQQNRNQPFLDETGYTEKCDLALPDPKNMKNLAELKAVLQLYGLDIIEAQRKLKMVVLEDISSK